MPKQIIYQLLPRLWGNPETNPVKGGTLEKNGCGKFRNIDGQTFRHLRELGVSYVWYTGIIRHATCTNAEGCEASDRSWVKGNAGSPYAITDYFDVNPYLADEPSKRMDEFEDLLRRSHEAGLGVILDFVPNHVARDYGHFSPKPFLSGRDANGHPVLGLEDDKSVHWSKDNDFFYYPGEHLHLPCEGQTYDEFPARASGNCFTPSPSVNDWYETVKINYCDFHTPTWDKMLEIIRFWASKGVDGFRCDMVELVPCEFFKWLISSIKEEFPKLKFIAEVYQKDQYGKYVHEVGFDWLYDKSGLYDALHDIVRKNVFDSGMPVEMWQSAKRITGCWQYLGGLQPYMLNFLENHDEQRVGSDFFAKDARNALAALHVSLLFNTAPFMLYFGQEIGERGMDCEGFSDRSGRTSIFDWWSIASVGRLYREIHGERALTDQERELLGRYKSLLRMATSDEAFQMGDTYDLCYYNLSSDGFNGHRHFAFLRDYEDNTQLVAANFSPVPASFDIHIPQHAFDWLKIPVTEAFNPSKPIKVTVPPMDGSVIKIC